MAGLRERYWMAFLCLHIQISRPRGLRYTDFTWLRIKAISFCLSYLYLSSTKVLLKGMPSIIHAEFILSLVGVVQSFEHNMHTDGHRPYKYPFCEWPLRRFEHTRRHTRIHMRERPYVCQDPGCQKAFPHSDDLARHSRIRSCSQSRIMMGPDQATTSTAHARIRRPESWTGPARIASQFSKIKVQIINN